MNNNLLQLKIKDALNKLDSKDYDNIECYKIMMAVNKAQFEIVRETLDPKIQGKQGVEQSTSRIGDLQILLDSVDLKGTNKPRYFESVELPKNYNRYSRVDAYAKSEECPDKRILKIDLAEVANESDFARDTNYRADFDWAETTSTVQGNKIRIATRDFIVLDAELVYYRNPRLVKIAGCKDPETGDMITVDSELEFKRDFNEIIVNKAVEILSVNLDDYNRAQFQHQQNQMSN